MKRNEFEIEICANSIESVIEAQNGGADRVELCESIEVGGTTPSFGLMSLVKEKSDIDVFALIRPRGGNFVYTKDEVSIMIRDIRAAISLGVDGVVIGCLLKNGNVDYDNCSRLIEVAKGLPINFHRAFDVARNPFEALEVIDSLGITRILTSGQENKAFDGVDLLSQLQQAAPTNLKIMAGSGIDETNIVQIAKKTGITAFHASLRVEIQDTHTSNEYKVKFNSTNEIPENSRKITSANRVRNLIKTLENEL
ncbi:MAG: copper homeostasis protein CutC [Chloroflexia bacterium]|nr:copper homeostasis protein CutC [Chloroflexia bacterium]